MPDCVCTSISTVGQVEFDRGDTVGLNRDIALYEKWSAALMRYQALLSESDKETDEQSGDAVADAIDDLIVLIPSPDLDALHVKMGLITQAGFGLFPAFWDAICADVERLARGVGQ